MHNRKMLVLCVVRYGLFLFLCDQFRARVEGFGGAHRDEVYSKYWQNLGHETLRKTLQEHQRDFPAKNVIFYLGDGMGISTVTAMRIYKGQKAGKSGEEELLEFDNFPYVSLAKTYALDRQNPDSANTATAYLCGVKANYGTLGVDGRVMMDDCPASKDKTTHVSSILEWAQKSGKWTGLVTSARVTHATPAGLYAHTASRNWEANTPDPECPDIATQLVHNIPGRDIHVILGGGRREFIPLNTTNSNGFQGIRDDSKNLLDEWLNDKKIKKLRAESVFDLNEFQKLDPEEIDYLLGLFSSSHLPYVADRTEGEATPSLQELTAMAIKILRKNTEGFFLMVEGARIDSAHHMNWAKKALEEGVEFDEAIKTGVEMTSLEDTLIVVTADHSHTFTIGGDYPKRGSSITGLGGVSDMDNYTMTILSYANGPGYRTSRKNLTQEEVEVKDFRQDTTYPLSMETHGAEDVAVYARGPMAHLFHGVHDQSYIPYAMAYALCIDENKELCKNTSSRIILPHYFQIAALFLFVLQTYCTSKLN